jgi:beta-N-acetylhexosaminidase
MISDFNPVIYGLSGTALTQEEIEFFYNAKPIGFILFSRNIQNKSQVVNLVNSLKNNFGSQLMILIDQEGGRVSRLDQPQWPKFPPAKYFGDLYKNNPQKSLKECEENFYQIGKILCELGINYNCAPMIDLWHQDCDNIIGDRSFGNNVDLVTQLGRFAIKGLKKSAINPIIKHIPGHGLAKCDSHLSLPQVDHDVNLLMKNDFKVFQNLKKESNMAMTAHIVYSKIDYLPATISQKTINFIREEIGFKNSLITDDLSMKALSGNVSKNSELALRAGCDILLHCNGDMKEMKEINSFLRGYINHSKN